jgi:hypothetical protein
MGETMVVPSSNEPHTLSVPEPCGLEDIRYLAGLLLDSLFFTEKDSGKCFLLFYFGLKLIDSIERWF